MKLNTAIKFVSSLLLTVSLSAGASIIDYVIDVSDDIYDPVGMTWDGTHLWVVDDENAFEVHQIDPITGDILSVFEVNPAGLAEPDPEGITWDGSHLWVMESSGVLGQYTTDGILVKTLAVGNHSNGHVSELDGVTWNDGTFWFTDKNNGEVFQIDEDGEGIGGFYTGLTEIDSIDFYNGSLWVGDDGSDKIYQYDAETFELLSIFDLEAMLIQAGLDMTFNDPKGLTWDDSGNLWFADDGDEVLVRINYNAVAVSEPSSLALFSCLLFFMMRKRVS